MFFKTTWKIQSLPACTHAPDGIPLNRSSSAEYAGTDLEAMACAENYHEWILDSITPYLGNTVAEVGAGAGNLTLLLSAKAERVLAFEPSLKMASILSERTQQDNKITILNSTFSDSASSFTNTFDSIVYINVLEHIEDDLAEIILAHSSLKSHGYLCLFVPALDWLYSEFDRSIGHYRRYTLEPLCQAVSERGFTIIKSTYLDLFGILPWWIIMVVLKRGLNPASTSFYDKLCIPAIRYLEERIRVPVGKNILVVAQKIPGA
jgi:SAM-dependent methyltransferase